MTRTVNIGKGPSRLFPSAQRLVDGDAAGRRGDGPLLRRGGSLAPGKITIRLVALIGLLRDSAAPASDRRRTGCSGVMLWPLLVFERPENWWTSSRALPRIEELPLKLAVPGTRRCSAPA